MENKISRKQFLTLASFTGAAFFTNSFDSFGKYWSLNPNSKFGGVQIGVITYSYRSMPHDINQLLQFCKDSGVSAIEMMGDPVEEFAGKPKNPVKFSPPKKGEGWPKPTEQQKEQMAIYSKQVAEWRSTVTMEKFKEVRKMFKKAGISIYAFKPNAFGPNNSDAEIEYGMRAAKALGAKSVTLEIPNDPKQSQRLGDLGAKNKCYVGYHAHLQATDTLWDTALSQSKYNSMNLDCGHYIAVGGVNTKESLLKLIAAKHDRITSMHIKDRTADGKNNLSWGNGDTPLKDILTLVKENNYNITLSIELEYEVPEGSDAVKEVKKCIDYARNILA